MSLTDLIAARIRAQGPISLADYMTDCLLHPTLGYYSTRDPFGQAGDFVTAPEISQMFGELIGLALAQVWLDQGSPAPFTLAELGPGRGTLMADALRAMARVPGLRDAAQLVLVEASPVLRDIQRMTLGDTRAEWIATAADLPDQPLFLIANEFFDALPLRQFERGTTGWHERCVGLNDGALALGLSAQGAVPALDHRLADTRPGDIVELCAGAVTVTQDIASRIVTHGGAALIIDYGDWHSLGDTVQALKNHRPVPILETPGAADLTAHVDFERIAAAAQAAGCDYSRLCPQGVFLERLGLTARAQMLADKVDENGRNAVIAAHRRLTHPDEMGNLFKVLGLYPHGAQTPPGLTP